MSNEVDFIDNDFFCNFATHVASHFPHIVGIGSFASYQWQQQLSLDLRSSIDATDIDEY